MKNKYQDELQKIVMSDELKRKIKEQSYASKPQKRKIHWRIAAGALSLACGIIIVFALVQQKDTIEVPGVASSAANKSDDSKQYQGHDGKTGTADADVIYDKATNSKKSSDLIKGAPYYPKTYNYVYGGFGAIVDKGNKASKLDMYTQQKTYTSVTGKLPVYEVVHPMKDVRYQNPLTKKEMEAIEKDYSEKLKSSKLPLSILADINKAFNIKGFDSIKKLAQIENDIFIKENGDVEIRTDVKSNGKEDTKEELEAASKSLFKLYQNIISIKNPQWNTTCKNHPYLKKTVCSTQVYEKGTDKEELTNQATSSVKFTSSNYEDHKTYYMTIFATDNLKKIKDVEIMKKDEAENILLAGGYFSDFPTETSSLKKENIKNVDLLYRDTNADNTDNYFPYVIPFYRFYIQDEEDSNIRIYDVPALYPEDLKELDKNTWYFE